MKKEKIAVAAIVFAVTLASHVSLKAGPNRNSRLGLGLGVGAPSALFVSGKYWLQKRSQAFDFAVRGGDGWVGGEMDYLWHKFYIFKGDLGRRLPLYFGGGTGVDFTGNNIGVRVQGKGGLTYFFDAPFDVFIEGVPAIRLTPVVGFDVGVALGGRYYW